MELNSMRNNGSNLDVTSISKSLEESNLPLHQCLDEKSIWFLTVCGVNWTKKPYYLPIIWYVVVLLIVFTFYIIYGPVSGIILAIQQGGFNVFILLQMGVTLQGIAAIFIVLHTRERMQQIVNKIDLFVFPETRKMSMICLLVFFATCFPYLVVSNIEVFESIQANFLLAVGHLASSALLSVNLLFLIVDAKVSMSLLTSLLQEDSIPVEEYNRVKAEIDNRVSKNRTNNSIVMGMALTNVILIFLEFIISEHLISTLYYIFVIIAMMSREVIYAVVGFWFVALVNEKSHELTKKLSKKVLVSDIESSVHHLKVFAIASADPISFPLAGMKLTRRDITFRFLIWLTGLFIGIARQKL
jgi:hypothetical protein